MKPSEVLATPEKWAKLVQARNASGKGVNPKSKDAVSWDVVGALWVCAKDNPEWRMWFDRIVERVNNRGYETPTRFNDDPNTTHADVLKLLTECAL